MPPPVFKVLRRSPHRRSSGAWSRRANCVSAEPVLRPGKRDSTKTEAGRGNEGCPEEQDRGPLKHAVCSCVASMSAGFALSWFVIEPLRRHCILHAARRAVAARKLYGGSSHLPSRSPPASCSAAHIRLGIKSEPAHGSKFWDRRMPQVLAWHGMAWHGMAWHGNRVFLLSGSMFQETRMVRMPCNT